MNKKRHFDIQMFAEGGAEGAAAGTENTSGLTGDFTQDFNRYVLGKESAPGSLNTADDDTSSGTEDGETDADTQDEGSTDGALTEDGQGDNENPEKEFEALIKGKFKDAFHKRTQGIINDRFKAAKATQGRLDDTLEAIAPLFARYGLNEGDIEGLSKAVKEDASIFTKLAMEKGIDTEEYRDSFYASRETEKQNRAEALRARQQAAQEQYQSWKQQEAELQKTYPSFNLQDAFKNEEFKKMAMSGSSLLNAYRASHFDEITTGLVAAATQRAARSTVDSMQGNVNRPAEGGMISVAGAVTKKDVSKLTATDIYDIIERVGRGEKISF